MTKTISTLSKLLKKKFSIFTILNIQYIENTWFWWRIIKHSPQLTMRDNEYMYCTERKEKEKKNYMERERGRES